jgi:hypothetical protein
VANDFNGDGYSDLVVGGPYPTGSVVGTGSIHYYPCSSAGLPRLPVLSVDNPRPEGNGHFGFSVASAGDLDADGFADLVVGEPESDAPAHSSGVAYIFRGGPEGPGSEPDLVLTDPSPHISSLFGFSVAAAGDIDADGFADLAVGALFQDGDLPRAGAIFIFRGSRTGVAAPQDQVLRSPVPQSEAEFGRVVRWYGDGNGDGFADLAVGAQYQEVDAPGQGAVFLFEGSATGLELAAGPLRTGSPGQAWASFGASLASAGDMNDDGFADLVIGEPFHDPSCEGTLGACGRAAVFVGGEGGLAGEPALYLIPDGILGPDYSGFGRGLWGGGDFDGDLLPDFVVLVAGTVFHGEDQLAAGVFTSPFVVSPETADGFLDAGPTRETVAGGAVDINGDGFADVLIGSPSLTDDAGRLYVYFGSGTGLVAAPDSPIEGPPGTYSFGAGVT